MIDDETSVLQAEQALADDLTALDQALAKAIAAAGNFAVRRSARGCDADGGSSGAGPTRRPGCR